MNLVIPANDRVMSGAICQPSAIHSLEEVIYVIYYQSVKRLPWERLRRLRSLHSARGNPKYCIPHPGKRNQSLRVVVGTTVAMLFCLP
jgi:hypothetical protein